MDPGPDLTGRVALALGWRKAIERPPCDEDGKKECEPSSGAPALPCCLAAAGCAPPGPQSQQGCVSPPPDAVQGAGNPTRAAILNAAYVFGSPASLGGRPAEAARAVAQLGYFASEIPTVGLALRGRGRRPGPLGIAPQAAPQSVVDALFAISRALGAGDGAAAQRSLTPPAFPNGPHTLQRLSSLPPLPAAPIRRPSLTALDGWHQGLGRPGDAAVGDGAAGLGTLSPAAGRARAEGSSTDAGKRRGPRVRRGRGGKSSGRAQGGRRRRGRQRARVVRPLGPRLPRHRRRRALLPLGRRHRRPAGDLRRLRGRLRAVRPLGGVAVG